MAPGELLGRYLETKREHEEEAEQNADDDKNDDDNDEVKSEGGSVPTIFAARDDLDMDIETLSAPLRNHEL